MIRNDAELRTTQERIAYLQNVLAQLRVTASAREFPLVSGGYRAEVERMQAEVADYLAHHASAVRPAEAA